MAAQQDPYVRVYYRITDDPKFAAVFDDDARLAAWLRLLLVADGTYPAPAPIPRTVRKAALRHLVDVGLVDLEPGDRFRIHGLASERGTRSERAADAAALRWHRRSDMRPDADAMRTHSNGNAGASGPASGHRMHSAPLLSEPSLRARDAGASDARTTDQEIGTTTRDGRRLVGGFTAEERRVMAEHAAAALVAHPTPAKANGKAPPSDEETIARCRVILADPDAEEWRRQAARDQLAVMGVSPEPELDFGT